MSPSPEPNTGPLQILELVPTIVWAIAPDATLSYMNAFGRRYLGFGRGSLDQTSLLDCVEPSERDRAEDEWSRRTDETDGWSSEFRIRAAGEEPRRMAVTSRAVRDPSGALVGWVGTFTDVEDERASADALRRNAVDMGLLLAEANDAARRERLRLSAAAGDSVMLPLEQATRDLALSLASLRSLLTEE